MNNEQVPQLPPHTFRLIRDLICDYCGIYFDDESSYLLQGRLSGRIRHHQLRDFNEYYYYLKYDRDRDREMAAVVDILTTNETYFFREFPQLNAFKEEILPEIKARKDVTGDRTFKLWSAGCSTGEEAYTFAMLILESELFDDSWEIEIFASDISQRVLGNARRALYAPSSFRAIDDYYLDKYFEPVENRHQVKSEVKNLVTFGQLNLKDRDKIALLGQQDVIVCRNVTIYFRMDTKKRVIGSLHDALRPGGFLLLGHSESLMNISTAFRLRHFKNDMVYQRPDASQPGDVRSRGGVHR